MILQQVYHCTLHLGSNFRMIGRQSVRVFGKAGITKFIINRDYIAVIVEAIYQRLTLH